MTKEMLLRDMDQYMFAKLVDSHMNDVTPFNWDDIVFETYCESMEFITMWMEKYCVDIDYMRETFDDEVPNGTKTMGDWLAIFELRDIDAFDPSELDDWLNTWSTDNNDGVPNVELLYDKLQSVLAGYIQSGLCNIEPIYRSGSFVIKGIRIHGDKSWIRYIWVTVDILNKEHKLKLIFDQDVDGTIWFEDEE